MKWRESIMLLSGGAVPWPLAARAQQPGLMRRIGMLNAFAESDPQAQTGIRAFEGQFKSSVG